MRYLFVLLALFLIPVLCFAETRINFEAENIDFALRSSKVRPDSLIWEVSGVFSFSNLLPESVKQIIAFPIPSGNGVSPHRGLELETLGTDTGSACELIAAGKQGFNFALEMAPRSFIRIRIYYRQMVGGNHVFYILKTANTWGRALPLAIYSLYLENGIIPRSLPLPRTRIVNTKTGAFCFWEFWQFKPAGDFEFEFDR